MKKTLIALAVLAASGAATAQVAAQSTASAVGSGSSVTLFGIVDATIAYGRAGGAGSANRWRLTNSGYNSSRLGFRGAEDLGGGMFASFWLEAGVNNDDGTGQATNTNNQGSGAALAGLAGGQGLTFNRRSYVALSGGWGELRLGRDYSPQFWSMTYFDPFGTNGVGTTNTLSALAGGVTGVTQVRVSNSVQYYLPPNMGGFYGQLAFWMGEQASNAGAPVGATRRDGNGYGFRAGYAAGPFNVALASGYTRYAASAFTINGVAVGTGGNVRQTNLAGQWDFGVGRLMGQIERDRNGNVDGRGWLLGFSVPVGAHEIRGSYSRYTVDAPIGTDPRSSKFALGYVHNLSKRTALYATGAWVRNTGGAGVVLNAAVAGGTGINQRSSGFDLGIRHAF